MRLSALASICLLAGAAYGVAGLETVGVAAAAESVSCDRPGHMVIVGGTDDPARIPAEVRERAKGYGPAVEALIKSYGASYIVRGRPFRIVEGEWPNWKSVVISTWPCRETGQVFWHSDKYQNEVKPLRKGSSSYIVGMFGRPTGHPKQTGQWTAEGGPSAKGLVCNKPVYFLVLTEVKDAARLAAYRQKLAETAIQYVYGAVDITAGAPVEDLEGGWPKNLGAKTSRWPCVEAFDAFYASAQYQAEIKPLREGSADFTAVILEAASPGG